MNNSRLFCSAWCVAFAAAALGAGHAFAQQSAATKAQVLILVGPSNHAPGTHEVAAGGRLVEYCLEHAENVKGIQADVVTAWPTDRELLKKVSTVVFSGDRFPPAEMPDGPRIMEDLSRMMDNGCGLVCFHYATGLGPNHVPDDGDHPLLRWMGGYFATRCKHHQSIARVYQAATIEPAKAEHPVLRGWKTFTVHDEPYINNYFGKEGMAKNVTALATSMLPPEAPKPEVVAWADLASRRRPRHGSRHASLLSQLAGQEPAHADPQRHRLVGEARRAFRGREDDASRPRAVRAGRGRASPAHAKLASKGNAVGIEGRDYFRQSSRYTDRLTSWGWEAMPPVCKWIIILNVVVYLLQIFVTRDAQKRTSRPIFSRIRSFRS